MHRCLDLEEGKPLNNWINLINNHNYSICFQRDGMEIERLAAADSILLEHGVEVFGEFEDLDLN